MEDSRWYSGVVVKSVKSGKKNEVGRKEPGPVTGAEPHPFLVAVVYGVLLFTTTSTWTASSIAYSSHIPENLFIGHRPR